MATEIKMPQFGVSMETGTVSQWNIAVGDTVKAGDVLASIETEKLTNDVVSEVDGVVLAIAAREGEDVPVQGLLAVVGQPGERWPGEAGPPAPAAPEGLKTPEAASQQPPAPPAGSTPGRIKSSPLARKVAAALHVDLSLVSPGGTSGRVKSKDVYAYVRQRDACPPAPPAAAPAAAPASASAAFPVKNLPLMDGDTTERLSGMRKTVAQRMYASAVEIPTVTQTVKVDMTALTAFRADLNAQREQAFSLNDFVLKAVAKALRRCPSMLVSLDGEQVIRRAHVNLGMAVAVEAGLIVPVIRDADKMGLEELSKTARDYAVRAREGRLAAEEYRDSTFTVSNLGMFGVESFTPIINQPDAAILGINSMEEELCRQADGSIGSRMVMRISLTYDHRLIDGAGAADFENCVRKLLESPLDILL